MKHNMDMTCLRPNTCGGTCYGCTLGFCKNCGQYEGGLATECPMVYIDEEKAQAIYAGELDYQEGKWIHVSS